MKKLRSNKLAFLLLLMCGGGGALWVFQIWINISKSDGELVQKPFWGALQLAEVSARGEDFPTLPIIERMEVSGQTYHVLVVKTNSDSTPYAWTILDANTPGMGIFSMPHDVTFATDCSEINRILTGEKVSALVEQFLMEACQ